MAIAKTGAMFKTLTFDGQSSRNYGVYITGEAVYNAPDRAVEMITIPGRNGAFARDDGRFENIEVTYPAGVFAENETDFAEAISNFRNMLCSRKGYCRLTDDYNPDEYREAVYKSGLEVTPALLRAGEFEITFECKPQRFLTSGETAVAVANNGTITNPTLFDSAPLLAVKGYGNMMVNGYPVYIKNIPLGDVQLWDNTSKSGYQTGTVTVTNTFDVSLLNTSDTFYFTGSKITETINGIGTNVWTGVHGNTGDSYKATQTAYLSSRGNKVTGETSFLDHVFTKGTPGTVAVVTGFTIYGGDATVNWSNTISYDGSDTVTWSTTVSIASGGEYINSLEFTIETGVGYGYSSVSDVLNAKYLDCDFGEAYRIINGAIIPINNLVSFPPELPVLSSGSNTITFDNTVTELKVTPRWWKI